MAEEMTAQPENTGADAGSGSSDVGGGVSGGDTYQELQKNLEDEIVNNDGSPLEDPEPKPQPKQGAKATQAAPKGGKPAADKAGDGGNAEDGKVPEGFLKGYFKNAEDGTISFDTEAFSKDVVGDAKSIYKYGERAYTPDDQAAKPKQEADPDEEYFRSEKTFRDNVRKNHLLYREELDKALKAGMSLEQADAVAMRNVDARLHEYFEERDIKRRSEERKSAAKKAEEFYSFEKVKATAAANQSRVISECGGNDKWQALCMQGIDHINWLFDMANPDFKGTKAETSKAMGDWFQKVASNEKSLRMVARILKGEAALQSLPYAFRQGMRKAAGTAQQNRSTHSRAPGGRSGSRAPAQEAGTRDSVDAWLNPIGEREGVMDTV